MNIAGLGVEELAALVLEFPPGLLIVGDEQVRDERIEKRARDAGVGRLLSPTDCVKDRLAGYYHWKDEQNFHQAVAVARRQPVQWHNLQRWHRRATMRRFRDKLPPFPRFQRDRT